MSRELAEEQMKRASQDKSNGMLINLYSRTISEFEDKYNELEILGERLYEYYSVEMEKYRVKVIDTEGETEGYWAGYAKDNYDTTRLDYVSDVVFAEYKSIIEDNISAIAAKMEQLDAQKGVYTDKLQEQLRNAMSIF